MRLLPFIMSKRARWPFPQHCLPRSFLFTLSSFFSRTLLPSSLPNQMVSESPLGHARAGAAALPPSSPQIDMTRLLVPKARQFFPHFFLGEKIPFLSDEFLPEAGMISPFSPDRTWKPHPPFFDIKVKLDELSPPYFLFSQMRH